MNPSTLLTPAADRGPNCLTTFWTQLAYHFNRRTAEPLGPSPAPGCDEPTSRCQTTPSLWTLGRYQPVIPKVPFVLYAMRIPRCRTGSLGPTFVSARLVGLTVKPPSIHTLGCRLPSGMRWPSRSSVTLWEETAPVKLTLYHCPDSGLRTVG